MNRKELSSIFNEIGMMLELMGENPFKSNAYYAASRKVETLEDDIEQLVSSGRLREIKGIGDTISKQIAELTQKGTSLFYEELKAQIPPGIFDMLRIPGLGPKKISFLWKKAGIKSLEQLERACQENRLVGYSGFGAKTQENLLQAISHFKSFTGKHLFSQVMPLAEELAHMLREQSGVESICIAGSLRRRKEIVKDIDLVAGADKPKELIYCFNHLPQVESVLASGETKSSVVLNRGINADLRVVSKVEFPFALHHFTGSREHNTAIRHRAKSMGLKINEYGIFDHDGKRVACQSEEDIFQTLGLAYIPPELREDIGEIEAAQEGRIPRLVEEADIKGVFHIHTNYSDGIDSLAQLAAAAQGLGFQYLGVSDHSQSAFYANGLPINRIEQQIREINDLNEINPHFTLFKGIEADILKDGSLDYPDEILAKFDFVIASIHSGFRMSESEATKRLITAMENPYVTMLGHPTGRILLGREGYPVDMKAVIEAAREYRVVLELNANPHRLDIDWRWCHYAGELGVMISINPDAHRKEELQDVVIGVGAARKGWLKPGDILNTRGRNEVKKFLQQNRQSKL